MRVIGILIIVVGLAIAVVPAFTNCSAEGLAIQLPGGKTVPMKCYWTAQASLVVGGTLAVAGLLLALSKTRETRLSLSLIAGLLSAAAVLLPTSLIGVCSMGSLCSSVEKPTMILGGVVGLALSAAAFAIALRSEDSTPPATTEGTAA